MTKKTIASLAVCFALASPAVHAQSADNAPIKLTTTGAAAQGFFAVVIEAWNQIYREVYPGSSVTFQPNSVGGGMLAVAEGKADIAMAMPPVEVQRAMLGQEPFEASLKGKIFQVMTTLEELDFDMIANKDWAEKNKVTGFADLAKVKPKMRLGASNRGTFYVNVALEEMFKAYGYSFADIEKKWGGKVYYNASGTNLQDLKDGKLDVIVIAGLKPDTRIAEMANNTGLMWMKMDKAVLDKIAPKLDMKVVSMPKSTYPFLTQDEWNLRAPSIMGAGAHVPASTVYKQLKALDQSLSRVQAVHPAFKNVTMEKLATRSPSMALHPGAEQFYREKGLLK